MQQNTIEERDIVGAGGGSQPSNGYGDTSGRWHKWRGRAPLEMRTEMEKLLAGSIRYGAESRPTTN